MKSALALIIGGLMIAAMGVGLGIFLGVRTTMDTSSKVTFLGPGQATLEAKSAGTYFLWNDYQTVFNGTSYHVSSMLPGAWTFTVTEDATGTNLPIETTAKFTVTLNSDQSNSIGTVQLTNPGNYTISAEGPDQRPFSFGYSPIARMRDGATVGAPVAVAGMLLGTIVLVVGIVKVFQASRLKHQT